MWNLKNIFDSLGKIFADSIAFICYNFRQLAVTDSNIHNRNNYAYYVFYRIILVLLFYLKVTHPRRYQCSTTAAKTA